MDLPFSQAFRRKHPRLLHALGIGAAFGVAFVAGTAYAGWTLVCRAGACPGGIGDVCNFPVRCVPQTCQGDIVCEDNYLRVDYCTGALSNLPI